MSSSLRAHAKALGFRITSDRGQIGFGKGTMIDTFWRALSKCTGEQDIANLVDEYGLLIWGRDNNHFFMAVPGEQPEYPKALEYPVDRDQIISVCHTLHVKRQQTLKYNRSSTRKSSTNLDGLFTPEIPSSDDDSGHLLHRFQSSPLPLREARMTSQRIAGETQNLSLTEFWVISQDYEISTRVTVGEIDKITTLFDTIKQNLLNDNPGKDVAARGNIKQLVVSFPFNFGDLDHLQVLSHNSDEAFLQLRRDIYDAYKDQREDRDGEEVKCICAVSFDDDPKCSE